MKEGAVNAIAALAGVAHEPKLIEVAGRKILLRPERSFNSNGELEVAWLKELPEQPPLLPQTLQVWSLTAVVDYLKAVAEERDLIEESDLVVHVVGSQTVTVMSGLAEGDFPQRAYYLKASANVPKHPFGTYQDPESFIVWLLTSFVDTPERGAVLRLVGNLRDESVRQVSDDGVSQTVVARKGVARVENVDVPNPVALAPFRTFREITQPPSLFLLRLRGGGEGKLPEIALFEADGGTWSLDAMQGVRRYLQDQLGDENEIPVIA
jgi:hypothetical protein